MALMSIFDIAGSAMNAQSQRLNVAASNLANADSVTGPDGQPYVAKQVVFQTLLSQVLLSAASVWRRWWMIRPRQNWFTNQATRWPMPKVM